MENVATRVKEKKRKNSASDRVMCKVDKVKDYPATFYIHGSQTVLQM